MALEGGLAREVANRQVAMFASFVGRGLHTTRAALAAASKVPESNLREYAAGAAMPFHAVLALRRHLPPQAINMLAEPGDARIVDVESVETNWDAIACSAAALVGDICEARSDGSVDHVEDARLRQRTRRLIAEAQHAVEEG